MTFSCPLLLYIKCFFKWDMLYSDVVLNHDLALQRSTAERHGGKKFKASDHQFWTKTHRSFKLFSPLKGGEVEREHSNLNTRVAHGHNAKTCWINRSEHDLGTFWKSVELHVNSHVIPTNPLCSTPTHGRLTETNGPKPVVSISVNGYALSMIWHWIQPIFSMLCPGGE